MHAEIETWGDVLKFLEAHPSILNQPAQIVKATPNETEVQTCLSGIAIGTVKALEFYRIRSVIDNKYRADDVVILCDGNPFAEDGAISYTMNPKHTTSKKSKRKGKLSAFLDMKPIYSSSGPTKISDQTCPSMSLDTTQKEKYIIKNRVKELDKKEENG